MSSRVSRVTGHGSRGSQVKKCDPLLSLGTIRYDTRRYFNEHSKGDTSQHNLPHGTKLKSGRKKLKSNKNGYAQKYR